MNLDIYDKALNVIYSCVTQDQCDIAKRYISRAVHEIDKRSRWSRSTLSQKLRLSLLKKRWSLHKARFNGGKE